MTTVATIFVDGFSTVFGPTTTSDRSARAAQGTTGANLQVFNLCSDDISSTKHPNEIDIDDLLADEGRAFESKVDAQGAWVADSLYPGQLTLATLRLRAGLSQKQLAQKCGWQQPTIARYESSKTEPGILQAKKLATALGVSLDDLARAFEGQAQTAVA